MMLVLLMAGVASAFFQAPRVRRPGLFMSTSPVVSLTEGAAAHIAKLRATEATPLDFLRLGVKRGGCGNEYSYAVNFVSEVSETDVVHAVTDGGTDGGFSVVVDADAVPLLTGLHLDVKESTLVFINPNTVHSCNCGNSFTIDADKKPTGNEKGLKHHFEQ